MNKLQLFKIILLFIIIPCGELQAQNILSQDYTVTEWEEDLDAFVQSLEKIHPDPYFRYNKDAFYSDLNLLKGKLDILTDDEVFLELSKLVTSLQDGHSHIPMHQGNLKLTAIPIMFYLFDNGLYIIDAKDNEQLVGKKVVRIGNRETGDLFNEIRKLIPADNIYHVKNNFPFYVNVPEFLEVLNAIESTDEILISVLDGNELKEVKVNTISRHEFFQWAFSPNTDSKIPLYRKKSNDLYWLSYISEEKIMYMKYNQVQSADSYSIQQITKNLDSLSRARNAEKIVIDLRDNSGGNSFTMRGLVNMLKGHPLNQPGKLFLVSGRKSNSAATNFISEMRLESNAILIGEPTGGNPNFYSDVRTVKLPNTRIEVAISTLFQKGSFYEDDRRSHYPDVPISVLSTDYFENNDPVIETIKLFNIEEPEHIPVSKSDLETFLGRYACTLTQACELSFENGYLRFHGKNVINKKLYYTGKLKFRDYNNSISIQLNPEDRNLTLTGYGINKVMDKLPATSLTAIEKIEHGKVGEGVTEIKDMLNSYPSPAIVSESVINSFGYRYLREKKAKEAIELFELNTLLYPKSANVYDSLGDAYLETNNINLAEKSFEEALNRNPDYEPAKRKLAEIRDNQK